MVFRMRIDSEGLGAEIAVFSIHEEIPIPIGIGRVGILSGQ